MVGGGAAGRSERKGKANKGSVNARGNVQVRLVMLTEVTLFVIGFFCGQHGSVNPTRRLCVCG